MSNIIEIIGTNMYLSTMSHSLKVAEMETNLKETGPFTIFAPTEIAFGKLHEGELAEWLLPANRVRLTGILNTHIIEGKTSFKDLRDGQLLNTLNGTTLEVRVTGINVTINGATVQGRDGEASNGVVHSLSRVLIPLN